MKSQDVARSPSPQDQKRERDRRAIIEALRRRIPNEAGVGCFLCRLIVEDFEKSGTLTDHPKDLNGHGIFPRQGKADHIRIEIASLDEP